MHVGCTVGEGIIPVGSQDRGAANPCFHVCATITLTSFRGIPIDVGRMSPTRRGPASRARNGILSPKLSPDLLLIGQQRGKIQTPHKM